MEIIFENKISVEDFNFLRKSVGWDEVEDALAKNSIENALYIIAALINGKTIGLAIVMGDKGYTVIIRDVIVLPEHQGKGIGKELMQKAMDYIRKTYLQKGQKIFVNLMAAKNRESFYKKFGFEERPNEKVGAGMSQMIEYE
jgi:GNAT superfamily N-acetyltransferase